MLTAAGSACVQPCNTATEVFHIQVFEIRKLLHIITSELLFFLLLLFDNSVHFALSLLAKRKK